jgi:hypothetical protein
MKAGWAPVLGLLIASPLHAQSAVSIWGSDLANSYHYMDRYEIMIDASPQEVWPRLLDFGSWMYDFDMKHESGPEAGEGATYRLYEGQDFFFRVVAVVPEKMVVGINLPSTLEGEASVGVAMMALAEFDGRTLVSNFMARQYEWHDADPNPIRARRESVDFQEFNERMWNGFLERLRDLVEDNDGA